MVFGQGTGLYKFYPDSGSSRWGLDAQALNKVK